MNLCRLYHFSFIETTLNDHIRTAPLRGLKAPALVGTGPHTNPSTTNTSPTFTIRLHHHLSSTARCCSSRSVPGMSGMPARVISIPSTTSSNPSAFSPPFVSSPKLTSTFPKPLCCSHGLLTRTSALFVLEQLSHGVVKRRMGVWRVRMDAGEV